MIGFCPTRWGVPSNRSMQKSRLVVGARRCPRRLVRPSNSRHRAGTSHIQSAGRILEEPSATVRAALAVSLLKRPFARTFPRGAPFTVWLRRNSVVRLLRGAERARMPVPVKVDALPCEARLFEDGGSAPKSRDKPSACHPTLAPPRRERNDQKRSGHEGDEGAARRVISDLQLIHDHHRRPPLPDATPAESRPPARAGTKSSVKEDDARPSATASGPFCDRSQADRPGMHDTFSEELQQSPQTDAATRRARAGQRSGRAIGAIAAGHRPEAASTRTRSSLEPTFG